MRNYRFLPVFSIVGAIGALCSCAGVETADDLRSGCATPVSSGSVAEEIRALEEAGAASNARGMSVEDAKRMFSPEYVAVGHAGSVSTRESMLKSWKPAPWASRFDIQELNIKVYCDMAVVIGLSEAEALGAPEGTKPAHFRWLNVWTKSNDEWRLSATHFTRF